MTPLMALTMPALAAREVQGIAKVTMLEGAALAGGVGGENNTNKLALHHNQIVGVNRVARPASSVQRPHSPFHCDAPLGIVYLT
jgi:hypothetical protein